MSAHILIADDVPEIGELLQAYLEGKSYRVTYARDGASARRVLQEGRVNLAILDMLMPGERGDSLAGIARSEGIPVILISGEPKSIERLAALPHAHLTKPFRLAELDEAIEFALTAKARARARRFRMKAEELRTAADQMKTADNRSTHQRLAETYDRLADQDDPPPKRDPDKKSDAG